MSRLRVLLASEWLAIRVQIGLGIVFLVAAWPKLLHPPVFAKNVHAYHVLPDALVNLQSLFLPGVEIVVGLALILGIRPRAAAWVGGLLLVSFMAALAWNAWVTQNPVNCSCFELNPEPKTCAQLLGEMKMLILRDLGLLLMAAHVIWSRGPRADRVNLAARAHGAPPPPTA